MNVIKHIINIGFRFLGLGLWFAYATRNFVFAINKFIRKLFVIRLRISFLCFSYSALISVCMASFSLPSFLNSPNLLDDIRPQHAGAESHDMACVRSQSLTAFDCRGPDRAA